MKKILKPLLIIVFSLLFLLIASVSFALWFVFTPERISPVIRNQADKLLTSQTEIGRVELTFFSTFPNFGLRVDSILLINPVENAQSDTLLSVGRFTGVVDMVALLRRNEIMLSGFTLENGNINAFFNADGISNLDIMVTDTLEQVTEPKEATELFVDLGKVELKNVNITYVDESLAMKGALKNVDARITGTIKNNDVSSSLNLTKSNVSFEYGGEKYLDNAFVNVDFPAQVNLGNQKINFQNALLSINGMDIALSGFVEMDTLSGDIITDLDYNFQSWSVNGLLAMVPPSYQSYLEGIELDGLLSSMGKIAGIYNDSVMPLMDLQLLFDQGTFTYAEYPIPLKDMSADIKIYTDLINDSLSYVTINSFKTQTQKSSFATRGDVKSLFTDMKVSLDSDADLMLDEFNMLIPDSLKVYMKGRLNGKVQSDFAMSHIDSMAIEKMKLSGNLLARNMDVTYDSIFLKTHNTRLNFTLPFKGENNPAANFALSDITAEYLEAGKPGDYYALLQNARFLLETSDARDTTRIPDLYCSFALESLLAETDSMFVSVLNPIGNLTLAPVKERPLEPQIHLVYKSGELMAGMSGDSVSVKKFATNTNIINDQSQTDVFLQWLARGFIDMEEGVITTTALNLPIQIPAIKMDFEPERLDIHDGRMIIDRSDFELSGFIKNLLSYARGDSILKGELQFNSKITDVMQLMDLTSGIGYEDSTEVADSQMTTDESEISSPEEETVASDTTYSDPYMVPKGIDIVLNTNVKSASLGVDTATNIIGALRINDGILLLDDINFATEAARMNITAMYRTPRKNHLFLGLDYHMYDIEIERLLQMIPDIDTLMPMLRSFRGKGEFHLAIQTNLDSTYNVKQSTLLGASSITGQNLVLMDGETFSEIAKTLRFSKKAENVVDSLSAEFTIFRKEIDIYPFLIVMDRYKAVVAGRHNFDLTFNYHISVVDSPLPVKLGLDIKGDLDDWTVRPAMPKYAQFYRPSARRAVENRQLELRRMIREALIDRPETEN